MVQLDTLQPNSWNPNDVPEHIMAGIRHGFEQEGWLSSQALTIWGTDEIGTKRDVIIDGEHRWLCALDVGLIEGPAVVLDGITERAAKALTVKLGKLRGTPVRDKVAAIMAELADQSATAMGFLEQELAELRASAAEQLAATGKAAAEALKDLEQQAPQRQRKRKRPEKSEPQVCVLIVCKDEADQRAKLDECLEKGWECRALI